MKEYFTEALVLRSRKTGETGAILDLFTKDLGRVPAKVAGLRRITSKLGGHLEPLCLSQVRLIFKNSFQVADALRLEGSRRLSSGKLKVLEVVSKTAAEGQPEPELWHFLKKALFAETFDEKTVVLKILEILGFGPEAASCAWCAAPPAAFLLSEGNFLCRRCTNFAKAAKDEIINL